jgi:hypothetical protein
LDEKAKVNNLLSARNTPYNQTHRKIKSESLEKDIPGMWKLKASRSSYSLISQNRV